MSKPSYIKPAEQVRKDALDAAYNAALNHAQQQHATALANVTARYPQTERDGWPELVADAQAGSGECIEAYALAQGVSVSDAATRVLDARSGYRKAWGEATGNLVALRDQVDALYAAGDVEGLKSIVA